LGPQGAASSRTTGTIGLAGGAARTNQLACAARRPAIASGAERPVQLAGPTGDAANAIADYAQAPARRHIHAAEFRIKSGCGAHAPIQLSLADRLMSFTIAIVGRPNVGKSTLFNRLVGARRALVDDQPGVTRDRREGEGRLGDLSFRIIDTAGLEDAAAESLSSRMQAQTAIAMAQADAVLFLIDARAGATPADRGLADLVRKSGKPAIVVANKSEGRAGEAGALYS
jgi:small GTP-binding protein